MTRKAIPFLVFFCALSAMAAGPPSPPSAVVRNQTEAVFNRPEFKEDSDGSSNWITRQLRDFFNWLGSLYTASPVLFWLILIVCIVLVLLFVLHLILAARASFEGGRNRRMSAEEAVRRGLSNSYRQEADRRAAAGEFTEAARFLFLSLVYRFDENGRVSLHKAYTNREYLDLLGERTPARSALQVMVDTLDDRWYGQQPTDREQYELCLQAYNRLTD